MDEQQIQDDLNAVAGRVRNNIEWRLSACEKKLEDFERQGRTALYLLFLNLGAIVAVLVTRLLQAH